MSNRPARTGPGLPAAARESERPVQNPSWQESNAGHEMKQGPLSEDSYVESKAALVAHIEFIAALEGSEKAVQFAARETGEASVRGPGCRWRGRRDAVWSMSGPRAHDLGVG